MRLADALVFITICGKITFVALHGSSSLTYYLI